MDYLCSVHRTDGSYLDTHRTPWGSVHTQWTDGGLIWIDRWRDCYLSVEDVSCAQSGISSRRITNATQPEKILIDVGVPSIKNLRWVVQCLSAINTYTSILVSKTHGSLRNHWNHIFQYTTCTGLYDLLYWPSTVNLDQDLCKNDNVMMNLNVSCDAFETSSCLPY